MTGCPDCGQGRKNKVCQSCQQERDQEWYERRSEEMKPGTVRVGPDADDVHTVGGDQDDA